MWECDQHARRVYLTQTSNVKSQVFFVWTFQCEMHLVVILTLVSTSDKPYCKRVILLHMQTHPEEVNARWWKQGGSYANITRLSSQGIAFTGNAVSLSSQQLFWDQPRPPQPPRRVFFVCVSVSKCHHLPLASHFDLPPGWISSNKS